MTKLVMLLGTVAALALTACGTNTGGAEAEAEATSSTAVDTTVGMGGAAPSAEATSGENAMPIAPETGSATMRGPGTGAPSGTESNAAPK